MSKFIDKLAAKVAARPREAALALIIGYACAAIAGFAFLVK